MVSWQGPYLVKGCRPDFNNGLRGDSNSGPIPPPPRVYESLTQIMALPGHLNLGLHLFMSPTYGFLAGAISGQGCRLDFNNGLKGDSNSDPILAPGVHSGLTQITASPRPSQSCVRWSYICSCLLLLVS